MVMNESRCRPKQQSEDNTIGPFRRFNDVNKIISITPHKAANTNACVTMKSSPNC